MAVGDVYRLIVGGLGGPANGQVACVFHYRQLEALLMDTPGEDLVQAWYLSARTTFLNTFSSAYAINMFKVRNPLDPTYGEDFPQVIVNGTRGGDQMPGQNSAFVLWRTGKIGRRYRGGNHLWPYSEPDCVGGVFSSTYVTDVEDFIEDAITIGDGINSSTYRLQVWSKENATGEPVTGGTLSLIPGTMSRRKPGRGS